MAQDQIEQATSHFFDIFNIDTQSLQEWERKQVCDSIEDSLKVHVAPTNEELVMKTLRELKNTMEHAETKADVVHGVSFRMGNREKAKQGLSIIVVILEDIEFTDSLVDHSLFGVLA